ncbi:class I SAM-dependent methyltransferase, partial [Acidihalobacter prosperus]
MSIHSDWDSRYAGCNPIKANPASVLVDNLHLLPSHGLALDLASGLGANALLMARRGLKVYAWDQSVTAISALDRAAQMERLDLAAEVRDVVLNPPPPETFDVIVVSRFLDRSIAPFLIEALRPEGLLLYQTFGKALVCPGQGPKQNIYRLETGEL